MGEFLTNSRARNVFGGGSIFFVVVFVALPVDSHRPIVNAGLAQERWRAPTI
jgi:nitric oxide reductase subunit C